MTKEEYEKLLTSDYWKGYSYSLIKERNFTCQDCGRSFPGERNKLQVHHLVYRDIMPWSYAPDEVVVLCKECHQRRHGIIPESDRYNLTDATSGKNIGFQTSHSFLSSGTSAQSTSSSTSNNNHSVQTDTKTPSGDNTSDQSASSPKVSNNWSESQYNRQERSTPTSYDYGSDHEHGSRTKRYASILALVLLCALIGIKQFSKKGTPNAKETLIEQKDSVHESNRLVTGKNPQSHVSTKDGAIRETKVKTRDADQTEAIPVIESSNDVLQSIATTESSTLSVNPTNTQNVEVKEKSSKSTMDLLEERSHANAVKRAQELGVSTEGSTMDILDRINHANAVKRAQEVGVSTEGSTMDILDRINHANAVKRAQEVGVSTEGSTMDILDRINHANAVKRAKEVGVSTEGSTMDILERINKKNLERY